MERCEIHPHFYSTKNTPCPGCRNQMTVDQEMAMYAKQDKEDTVRYYWMTVIALALIFIGAGYGGASVYFYGLCM